MLCNICHKNIATIHLTELVNNKIIEMHICQVCARSKAEEINEKISLSNFLGGLVNLNLVEKEETYKCSKCGLTYEDFKKNGRLGCANCYTSFKNILLPLLRKLHGSIYNTGKTPLKLEKKLSYEIKIKDLRDRLERAIKLEEYEEAIRLRDEIKKLEKGNK